MTCHMLGFPILTGNVSCLYQILATNLFIYAILRKKHCVGQGYRTALYVTNIFSQFLEFLDNDISGTFNSYISDIFDLFIVLSKTMSTGSYQNNKSTPGNPII